MRPGKNIFINNVEFTVSASNKKGIVRPVSFEGENDVIKFLKRTDDKENTEEGPRSETKILYTENKNNQTISCKLFFPSKTIKPLNYRWGVFNWNMHSDIELGEEPTSPSIICYMENDHLYLRIWSDAREINSFKGGGTKHQTEKLFNLGICSKDRWLDLNIKVHFSYKEDGYFLMQFDEKIYEYVGANDYNNKHFGTFAIGIYAWTQVPDYKPKPVEIIEYYIAELIVK